MIQTRERTGRPHWTGSGNTIPRSCAPKLVPEENGVGDQCWKRSFGSQSRAKMTRTRCCDTCCHRGLIRKLMALCALGDASGFCVHSSVAHEHNVHVALAWSDSLDGSCSSDRSFRKRGIVMTTTSRVEVNLFFVACTVLMRLEDTSMRT